MFRLQTVGGFGGKSDQLNAYNMFLGDPAFFDRDLARYRAVTPASLGEAMARYLDHDRRVALERRAARTLGARASGVGAGGRVLMAPEAGAANLARPDRSRLPEPGPVTPFRFPTIQKSTCAERPPGLDRPPSGDSGRLADAARAPRRGGRSARPRRPGGADRRHARRRAAAAARRSRCTRRSRGSARSSTSDIGSDAALHHGHGAQPLHRTLRWRCSPTWSRGRRSPRRTSCASASSGCTG